jgi:hypothetical protein
VFQQERGGRRDFGWMERRLLKKVWFDGDDLGSKGNSTLV